MICHLLLESGKFSLLQDDGFQFCPYFFNDYQIDTETLICVSMIRIVINVYYPHLYILLQPNLT